MANINLLNAFKPLTTNITKNTSLVDSSITIPKKTISMYSDIKFDLEVNEFESPQLNSKNTTTDLNLITDESCIIQAIKNILNTKYYTRLLNPDLNIDLNSYLFENLTEAKAFFIGYDLQETIPAYEPRVKVSNVKVVGYYDSSTYEISLSITIPSLKKNVKISSILSSEGFTFKS